MNLFGEWFKKKYTVLIIDDNEQISTLLSIYLKAKGFTVKCADNGADGLAQIGRSRPDLVLLDITMPRMDGFDTLLGIKSNPKTKDVPVVMCTDHSSMKDVEKCCKWGAEGYVLKPFDLERVLEKVNAVIQAKP